MKDYAILVGSVLLRGTCVAGHANRQEVVSQLTVAEKLSTPFYHSTDLPGK